jgi:hypothetical protein
MHEQEPVLHLVDGERRGLHFVPHRVVLIARDECVDSAVERGGEQQHLVPPADAAQQPLDLR